MNGLAGLDNVEVFYGKAQALHGVTLAIAPGETLALVGRNGAGKSTLLKTLAGLLECRSGRRWLDGNDISHLSAEETNRLGVAYVPENRQIFPNLTVEENLRITRVVQRREGTRWTMDDIWSLFPGLHERRRAKGQNLSGGEQQMLAVSRAMMCNPRLLLLDEPTEGLAPIVIEQLIAAMKKIAANDVALVVVEQNLRVPKILANWFLVVDNGSVQWSGDLTSLNREYASVERILSV